MANRSHILFRNLLMSLSCIKSDRTEILRGGVFGDTPLFCLIYDSKFLPLFRKCVDNEFYRYSHTSSLL